MDTIGGRIREARQRKVLSQAELAQATGMPRPSLTRIENGHTRPRPATIRKLAAQLDVSPQWLAFGDAGDSLGQKK
jgi:transcriptional regulator with XRE-family HTH domain